MSLDDYRMVAQLGAGSDGVSYKAEARADGGFVEIRILNRAPEDPNRWADLSRKLRLAALLDHAGAVRIHQLGLDHDPPYLVADWIEGKSLTEEMLGRLPLRLEDALGLLHDVVKVVAAAHRLGLGHGQLCPSGIVRGASSCLKIDFAGTQTKSEEDKSRHLDLSCQPPEFAPAGPATLAADIYSLGAILFWLLTGEPTSAGLKRGQSLDSLRQTLPPNDQTPQHSAGPVDRLLTEMLAPDPVDRPAIAALESELAASLRDLAATGEFVAKDEQQTVATVSETRTVVSADAVAGRQRLGRFRLLEKLGEGGMGAVYRALDMTDGAQVAIKVLRSEWAKHDTALRRFNKEARLLAEVNNPYVANLLEINEDEGIHYLALEYVAGKSLDKLLGERGQLSEPLAVGILADVARALVEAHERGIVHRDIKPENILLVSGGVVSGGVVSSGVASGGVVSGGVVSGEGVPADGAVPSTQYSVLSTQYSVPAAQTSARDTLRPPLTTHHSPKVKLTDFGLARHVVESESLNLTQTGALVGTPYYMAPEQCSGNGEIAPPTDIYAMGATLFHLLTGRPPFVGNNYLGVIAMHCHNPPPLLKSVNAEVSEATSQIVDKCLAKAPEARFANAGALLRDLERVLRGEPTSIVIHPRLPACEPANVVRYDWTWELEASPQQLWPHVSNTERLNRACGLPAIQFSAAADEKGVRRYGKVRKLGLTAAWQEHPFEWIEARRFGVLREFTQGPFKWVMSVVDMAPRSDGGTTLSHRVRVEPRGLLGRTAAAIEIGVKGRRALDRVYRRIDAAVTGQLGGQGLADPFEEPASVSKARRGRLDALLEKLHARGVDPAVVERFGDFLALAPAQEVARIRPLALARRLAVDPEQLVAACLHGAREGLLVLLWDILCPVCRIPSEVKDTLKALREHGRCEACNLDFELDFGNSVEMIFRAHPEIRDTELGVYCIGGPAHSPHVLAQVRVGQSERIELDLALPEGAYRLRGPQLPYVLDFRVQPGTATTHWELNLARGSDPDLPRTFKPGRQVIALTNDQPLELVVRVERAAPRADALTAARGSAMALFRELFPGEVLSPGRLVSVANITLLVSALDQSAKLYHELGDAKAFALIHEHFRLLEACIRREGGALVKTVGDGVVASFTDPVAAVRTGLDMHAQLAGSDVTKNLSLRLGVHRGPAMAATLNDHLDYFGGTANLAMQLPQLAPPGTMILSQAVAGEPEVVALLRQRDCGGTLLTDSEVVAESGPILCFQM